MGRGLGHGSIRIAEENGQVSIGPGTCLLARSWWPPWRGDGSFEQAPPETTVLKALEAIRARLAGEAECAEGFAFRHDEP
ncbi:MAG: hypothetical protein K2W96_14580 [Gemmataceae bacterium]|nr:hypothetical protein [Gemmataceae bacterium]